MPEFGWMSFACMEKMPEPWSSATGMPGLGAWRTSPLPSDAATLGPRSKAGPSAEEPRTDSSPRALPLASFTLFSPLKTLTISSVGWSTCTYVAGCRCASVRSRAPLTNPRLKHLARRVRVVGHTRPPNHHAPHESPSARSAISRDTPQSSVRPPTTNASIGNRGSATSPSKNITMSPSCSCLLQCYVLSYSWVWL